MNDDDYVSHIRQAGIVDPESLVHPVTIVGVGGIGSSALVQLRCLGVEEFTLIDPDRIDHHNPPSQWIYAGAEAGRLKVEVAAEYLRRMGCKNVTTLAETYTNQPLAGIVVSGVDNMHGRQAIWANVQRDRGRHVPLLLDGRMGGTELELVCVIPALRRDREIYEELLFPDEEMAPLPCGREAVIYTLTGLGAEITRTMGDFAAGRPFPRRVYHDYEGHIHEVVYTEADPAE
jgi:hypothetical protein